MQRVIRKEMSERKGASNAARRKLIGKEAVG
jgi:hypothetical protein